MCSPDDPLPEHMKRLHHQHYHYPDSHVSGSIKEGDVKVLSPPVGLNTSHDIDHFTQCKHYEETNQSLKYRSNRPIGVYGKDNSCLKQNHMTLVPLSCHHSCLPPSAFCLDSACMPDCMHAFAFALTQTVAVVNVPASVMFCFLCLKLRNPSTGTEPVYHTSPRAFHREEENKLCWELDDSCELNK